MNGIPNCLKHSTAGGIGMFIAFVGLRNANLVVGNPATLSAWAVSAITKPNWHVSD